MGIRWALAAVAVLVLSGCGTGTPADDDGPVSEPTTEPSARDVALDVEATVATRPQPDSSQDAGELLPGPRERGLLVSYSVTNTGTEPVLVVDRIPVKDGSASGPSDQIDPLKAFLAVDGDVATIAKRTFPRSADAPDFTVRFQASVAAPGATVKGLAFVPLPLATDDAEADRWRLCLGIIPKVLPSALLPGGERAMVPNDRLAGDLAQRLACSPVRAVPAG